MDCKRERLGHREPMDSDWKSHHLQGTQQRLPGIGDEVPIIHQQRMQRCVALALGADVFIQMSTNPSVVDIQPQNSFF